MKKKSLILVTVILIVSAFCMMGGSAAATETTSSDLGSSVLTVKYNGEAVVFSGRTAFCRRKQQNAHSSTFRCRDNGR